VKIQRDQEKREKKDEKEKQRMERETKIRSDITRGGRIIKKPPRLKD